MAIAASIVTVISDAAGKQSDYTAYLPTSLNLTQFREFGQAMAVAVDAFIHGRLDSVTLKIDGDISGLTNNTAEADSDVEDVGFFEYQTAEGRSVKMNLPGVKEAAIVDGSYDLDTAQADVAAFDAMMRNGIAVTGGTAIPCARDESDITTLAVAEYRSRPSGKRVS